LAAETPIVAAVRHSRLKSLDSNAGTQKGHLTVNPIFAAPAAVLGAMAVAPRVADLVTGPADFLATLRKAVGPQQAAPAQAAAQSREAPETAQSLRRRLDTALDALHRQLQARLAAAGADPTLPFSAELNSRGRIHVQSDHPDADKIRRLLSDDRELAHAALEIRQLAEALNKTDSRNLVLSYTPQRLTVG
jgi:hypothetical protein